MELYLFIALIVAICVAFSQHTKAEAIKRALEDARKEKKPLEIGDIRDWINGKDDGFEIVEELLGEAFIAKKYKRFCDMLDEDKLPNGSIKDDLVYHDYLHKSLMWIPDKGDLEGIEFTIYYNGYSKTGQFNDQSFGIYIDSKKIHHGFGKRERARWEKLERMMRPFMSEEEKLEYTSKSDRVAASGG